MINKGLEWLNRIENSFDNIIEGLQSGEIDIDEVERLELIDESQDLDGDTPELRAEELNLIKHINHYFTRIVKEHGEIDELEKVAIESSIAGIMANIRKMVFGTTI